MDGWLHTEIKCRLRDSNLDTFISVRSVVFRFARTSENGVQNAQWSRDIRVRSRSYTLIGGTCQLCAFLAPSHNICGEQRPQPRWEQCTSVLRASRLLLRRRQALPVSLLPQLARLPGRSLPHRHHYRSRVV